ncbi:MAG: SCP2 sterol-binding domain-containing protein [Actinobacteria bacterium]|nr:SCP2 sterol-binding domain-containing protein [Actinomycetota bacterium]
MAVFLSPEWVAELDAAARATDAATTRADDLTLTVQQVVQGAPNGEVRYYVTIDRDGVRVRPGSADAPDLTLFAKYDVARAINAGTADAQDALAVGRLKIKGRLEQLLEHQDAFAALDDLFASVRNGTTYEDGPTMPS